MLKTLLRSPDYKRRRAKLLKARLAVFTLMGSLFGSLIVLCSAEGALVRFLLQENVSFAHYFLFGALISSFLVVYSILLSRLVVHILYNLENAAIAQTIATSTFVLVYAFVFYRFKNIQPLLYLAVGKLLAVLLLFRFWRLRFFEAHDRLKSALAPQRFLVSWSAFSICRWVVIACFLLMFLGMALAFVSTHPVIELAGWEGLVLMLSFYFVFRAFAQSPHAHSSIFQKDVAE